MEEQVDGNRSSRSPGRGPRARGRRCLRIDPRRRRRDSRLLPAEQRTAACHQQCGKMQGKRNGAELEPGRPEGRDRGKGSSGAAGTSGAVSAVSVAFGGKESKRPRPISATSPARASRSPCPQARPKWWMRGSQRRQRATARRSMLAFTMQRSDRRWSGNGSREWRLRP